MDYLKYKGEVSEPSGGEAARVVCHRPMGAMSRSLVLVTTATHCCVLPQHHVFYVLTHLAGSEMAPI